MSDVCNGEHSSLMVSCLYSQGGIMPRLRCIAKVVLHVLASFELERSLRTRGVAFNVPTIGSHNFKSYNVKPRKGD